MNCLKWFQVVSGSFLVVSGVQVVLDGFRWFQVVSRFSKYVLRNDVNFKYTRSFLKKMFSYLTRILIYSSTKYALEHSLKYGCSENFVTFAEKYLRHSLMLRKLKHVELRLI